jgi:hypothetical protein
MDLLDNEGIVALAGQQQWPALSIYLPTHRYSLETDEDRIRLRNLLRDASERLVADGMRAPETDAFCEPVRAILEDGSFWRNVSDGLAIFISPQTDRAFRTDRPMPEQVVVGDRFYLRPLVSAYYGNHSFFALAIDMNGSRLFRGDQSNVEPLDLGDAPLSLNQALAYDEAEQNVHYPTHAGPHAVGITGGSGPFHGHGGSKELAGEHRERFVRGVERAVAERLSNESAPLVLLGVERLVAEYRLRNTYGYLSDAQVLGATDHLSPQQVHAVAIEALRPTFEAALSAELSELRELEGTSLASHDPAEIVAAAATGRVRKLFFDESVGPFGTLDRSTMAVDEVCAVSPRYLREAREPESGPSNGECGWDLVDLAAAETALHGGEIRSLSGENPPIRGVAAIFRY